MNEYYYYFENEKVYTNDEERAWEHYCRLERKYPRDQVVEILLKYNGLKNTFSALQRAKSVEKMCDYFAKLRQEAKESKEAKEFREKKLAL